MRSDVATDRAAMGDPPHETIASALWSALDLRQLSADLSVVATGAAVLGVFAISPLMLEHFQIAYLTSGGSAFSKFHPSTFAAVLALLLRCLATVAPLRTGWNIVTRDGNVVILAIAVAIAGFAAVAITKTPVTPLLDTFLLPALLFVLLRDLHPAILKWLALLLALLFCVNAVMGLYEFLNATHIVQLPVAGDVSSDPTRSDAIFDWRAELMQDWRATALLGHPLVNGLIVGGFILCLVAPGAAWLPLTVRVPLVLLQFASMFAFGARVSLVLTIAVGAFFVLGHLRETLGKTNRISPRALGLGLIAATLLFGVCVGLYATGFFDRTIERFTSDDGSARTRELMFQLFQPLSWSEIMLGPSQEVVATWQRVYGLEFGIESSWVGLILSQGLIVTACIVGGLIAFSRSVVQTCGRGTTILLLFFFISVSGTTGLSGKTTSLAMVVALALLFLRRDEQRLPLRSVLSVKCGVLR